MKRVDLETKAEYIENRTYNEIDKWDFSDLKLTLTREIARRYRESSRIFLAIEVCKF